MTISARLRLALYSRIVNSCTRIANRCLRISGWALQRQANIIQKATGRPILVKEDMQP